MNLQELLLGQDPTTMAARGFLAAVLVTLVAPSVVESWSASWPVLARWPLSRVTGLAVVSGVLAGAVTSSWLAAPLGAVVGMAAAMAVSGALADLELIDPAVVRRVSPFVAAAVAVGAGIRFPLTGVAQVDLVVAVLWLARVPVYFRLVEPRRQDRLRLVMSVSTAAGVLLLAAPAGKGPVAALGAATLGAALALLASRSAAEDGSVDPLTWLIVGFLLVAMGLQAVASRGSAVGVLIPLLMWTVPLVDAAIASLARLRRGYPLGRREGGHLIRRLEARGLSSASATWILAGAHLLVVVAAVGVGRGLLAPGAALAVGALTVVGLVALVASASVHSAPPRAFPRWFRLARVGVVLVPIALAGPAVATVVAAVAPAQRAQRALQDGLDGLTKGDPSQASADFEAAAAGFGAVARQLDGPMAALGLAVPVLAPNLRAARTLAGAGQELAGAGRTLVSTADLRQVKFVDGAVPLEEIRQAADTLSSTASVFREVNAQVGAARHPYVLPVVRRALDDLSGRLATYGHDVETAAEASKVLPGILGGSGPRRYFLAVQNTAEARGAGGAIGNFGELVADNGRIRVARFGRLQDLRRAGVAVDQRVLNAPPEYVERYGRYEPQSTWQNVNMSPDFPTVAGVIADQYRQSQDDGPVVDGVIAIDPAGLASLLELTGPISVSGWPEKISSDNVVRITLSEAYQRFAKATRIDFLAEVAAKVMESLTGGDLKGPTQMAEILGRASRQHHLMMFLRAPQEQALLARVGGDGAIPAPNSSDSLLVVNQNAGANKVDYYLRRQIRYAVKLAKPVGNQASATAALDVTLTNQAPSSGVDPYVIGPNIADIAPGENYSIVSAYGQLDLTEATFDGRPLPMDAGTEFGRAVNSAFVRIPSQTSRTLHLGLGGKVTLASGGWYSLELLRQPTIAADDVEISVQAPEGYKVAEAVGLQAQGAQARGRISLDANQTVRVRLERAG